MACLLIHRGCLSLDSCTNCQAWQGDRHVELDGWSRGCAGGEGPVKPEASWSNRIQCLQVMLSLASLQQGGKLLQPADQVRGT